MKNQTPPAFKLAALLNRAAAAIETPADLNADERRHVCEDLCSAADAIDPAETTPPAAGEAAHTLTATPTPQQIDAMTSAELLVFLNSHATLIRHWSELAYRANVLACARTKQERDAAALKVFCAIGDAKDALPDLRTLDEARAALHSAQP